MAASNCRTHKRLRLGPDIIERKISNVGLINMPIFSFWSKLVPFTKLTFFFFFSIYIYNLHFFKQKIYSHQVLIYLNVPGIPVRKPLQNRQIVSWRTTGCVSLGVICASLLTGRHLLMNKKDKNSRYTNIKIMII